MSLTDIMSAMDLVVWPEIALVLFMAVFFTVVFRTYARDRKRIYEEAGRLPLEEPVPLDLGEPFRESGPIEPLMLTLDPTDSKGTEQQGVRGHAQV